ncbi:MAG TPA: hypothetical protein VH372_05450, partial [Actinospica sp.]|nr:hypothetical protein [Actinospica sp.]
PQAVGWGGADDGRLAAIAGVREVVLLSTCNRIELFASVESAGAGSDLLQALGAAAAPLAPPSVPAAEVPPLPVPQAAAKDPSVASPAAPPIRRRRDHRGG